MTESVSRLSLFGFNSRTAWTLNFGVLDCGSCTAIFHSGDSNGDGDWTIRSKKGSTKLGPFRSVEPMFRPLEFVVGHFLLTCLAKDQGHQGSLVSLFGLGVSMPSQRA